VSDSQARTTRSGSPNRLSTGPFLGINHSDIGAHFLRCNFDRPSQPDSSHRTASASGSIVSVMVYFPFVILQSSSVVDMIETAFRGETWSKALSAGARRGYGENVLMRLPE
jgi:hypothetical protein